ncbi:MAG: hypothetical protein M1833_006005 [Piccolia ochrophora]|nr:MAG: hypothetical protein M1833_006005 [Piccolia ochrophora]
MTTLFSPIDFTIPSVHDGITIDCRLHLPTPPRHSDPPRQPPVVRGAVMAHPYAPLGGSYNDRVVGLIVQELLQQDFVTMTFNFRGAGDSQGKTSWTGKPELADYESAVGFLLSYLDGVEVARAGPGSETGHVTTTLVLGGYSYGSLIASHLPSTTKIWKSFADGGAHGIHAQIRDRASKMADTGHQQPMAGDYGRMEEVAQISTLYLLVSPILPPVSSLATMFAALGPESIVDCPTLAVYGSADAFTSKRKLCRWAEDRARRSGSGFVFREIESAGHFWIEEGVDVELKEAVGGWMRSMMKSDVDAS